MLTICNTKKYYVYYYYYYYIFNTYLQLNFIIIKIFNIYTVERRLSKLIGTIDSSDNRT